MAYSQTALFCTFVLGKFQKERKETENSLLWGKDGEVVGGETTNPACFWSLPSPGEGNGLDLPAR